MSIEIIYCEAVSDAELGRALFSQIEEALLPHPSSGTSPVFFSKKFVGREEYRWQVVSTGLVSGVLPATTTTFKVALTAAKAQIEKDACLTYIMGQGKAGIKTILHRGNLVEVEYGHSLSIGKVTGEVKSNKRYPETVQTGSMPKRRLAIVIDAKVRGKGVVQVVPISSNAPGAGDRSTVEVTGSLTSLVDYQLRSWAICSMIESVSPTRIFAARVKFPGSAPVRDKGFKSGLGKHEMGQIDAALVHGVALQDFMKKKEAEKSDLSAKVAQLEVDLAEAQLDLEEALSRADLLQGFRKYLCDVVGDLADEWEHYQERETRALG